MVGHGSMETDRLVLLALPMTSVFQSRYPSWSPENRDLHSWKKSGVGVELELNAEGRILELKIRIDDKPWTYLQGEVPSQLCTLSLMVELDLSGNKLTGSIPPELAKLKMLKTLLLGSNNLTGAIPTELGGMLSLEHLRLSNNDLTGCIPSELGNLRLLKILDLKNNKLSGAIPPELGKIETMEDLSLGINRLSGSIPVELCELQEMITVDLIGTELTDGQMLIVGNRGRVLRWQQALKREKSRPPTPWASQAVDGLIVLWHFVVPVLDDYTDVVLLWLTYGDGTSGLWWICAIAMVLAEVDRLYIAVTPVLVLLLWILKVVGFCLGLCDMHCLEIILWDIEVAGTFGLGIKGLRFDRSNEMLVLDGMLWVLLGSRARSTDLMSRLGMAGEVPNQTSEEAALTVRAIDRLLYWNPYRCLGEFIFRYPYGHRINRRGGGAARRADAMVKAVGETLVVDPLFLALGLSTSGWDGNITGAAAVSALLSVLELLTELQHYTSISLSYMEATAEMEGPQRAPSARGTATSAQQVDQNVSGDRQP